MRLTHSAMSGRLSSQHQGEVGFGLREPLLGSTAKGSLSLSHPDSNWDSAMRTFETRSLVRTNIPSIKYSSKRSLGKSLTN